MAPCQVVMIWEMILSFLHSLLINLRQNIKITPASKRHLGPCPGKERCICSEGPADARDGSRGDFRLSK